MAKKNHISDYAARNHEADAREVSALCLRLLELRQNLWKWHLVPERGAGGVDVDEMREIEADIAYRGISTHLEA